MYHNIHTHTGTHAGGWAIQNLLRDFASIPLAGLYSAGLHPWYLQAGTIDNELEQLDIALQQSNVLLLGECGLDKVCDTDYALQQRCFQQQVLLANQHGKPLLLHCVRAFDDVLRILKETVVAVPVIFHGYHKSAELALQLVKAGHHLSFGKHLQQPATAAVFKTIPLNHVFLETDDAAINIEELYHSAAAIKNITVAQLQQQITANINGIITKLPERREGY